MKTNPLLNLTPVKFVIAVGGIYTSYIYFGLIMEKLFKTEYPNVDPNKPKENFTFGFATSLFQNFFCYILALCVNRFYYKQYTSKMDLKSEIIIGSCSFGSVFMASQALAWVSFPVQAIMKSSKIISILIVSLLLGSKGQHTRKQYLCGFIITLGIIIFNLTSEKAKGEKEDSFIGIVAILISLFCDGLLGTTQGEIKKLNPSQWDQMESLNKWAGLICLTVANVSFQMGKFIQFVMEHPTVIKDLVILAVLGTIGQIFIFYTIANFSPLILSIVTTTRKFFTVLASIVLYHHHMTKWQWVSIVLVFVGVFMEMAGGAHKRHAPVKEDKKSDDIEARVLIGVDETATRRAIA